MRANYLLRNYIILFIGLSIVLMGCNKEPKSEDFVNITDQYAVELHQELTQDGGSPSLHITSIEPQDCINAYISHQTIISEHKLELILNDILTEGACDIGNKIVSEEILIGLNNPALPIEINLKNVIKNTGTLYIHDYTFDLELDKFDGLKITRTHLNKILPKMLWGSYFLSDENIAQAIGNYINELDNKASKANGDYGHFYVTQDDSIVIYGDENESKFTFLITSENDFEKIELKIQEFKQLDPSLVFQATNYDGSTINIE